MRIRTRDSHLHTNARWVKSAECVEKQNHVCMYLEEECYAPAHLLIIDELKRQHREDTKGNKDGKQDVKFKYVRHFCMSSTRGHDGPRAHSAWKGSKPDLWLQFIIFNDRCVGAIKWFGSLCHKRHTEDVKKNITDLDGISCHFSAADLQDSSSLWTPEADPNNNTWAR